MPRIIVNGHPIINYDYSSAQKRYWKALSDFIISKYGRTSFEDPAIVESVLLDCFQYLSDTFKQSIAEEKVFRFYLYLFLLHEESIKLYIKILGGTKLEQISEYEFALYRRILKLILEQGCEHELTWGSKPTPIEINAINEKIQDLLYLGTWLYQFADNIAYQKMIGDAHVIKFTNEDYISVSWKYHYGICYDELMHLLVEDYEKATFDEKAVYELKERIETCFNINYDFAAGIIFEIQKHLNPQTPNLQTIEPYVLPENLINQFHISEESAKRFYDGLSLKRTNKLTIEQAIYKPHSLQRYLFRPILIYNIGGVERALVGIEKFAESLATLATNALHWNALPEEWKNNKCISDFLNKKGREHDKILEDKIEEILKEEEMIYCRNIKSFKRPTGGNLRIDNDVCGEIDFIIINRKRNSILVADSKYNRAKQDGVGYRNDYSNFISSHEPQLSKKISWISGNLEILENHLKIIYSLSDLSILDFSIEAVFFINTPTFYMFNGDYKAITLKQVRNFINGAYEYPTILLTGDPNNKDNVTVITHPYFRKPN